MRFHKRESLWSSLQRLEHVPSQRFRHKYSQFHWFRHPLDATFWIWIEQPNGGSNDGPSVPISGGDEEHRSSGCCHRLIPGRTARQVPWSGDNGRAIFLGKVRSH